MHGHEITELKRFFLTYILLVLKKRNPTIFCFFRCEGSAKMYGLNILPYDSSFPGLPNRTGGEITKRTPLHIFLNLKLQDLSTAENT